MCRLPLASFNFLLQGKLKTTKKKLAEIISELGGTVATTVSYKVGICIIPDGDGALEKLPEKILTQLEEKQIPVVGESFISEVKEKGKLVPVLDHLLSSWGQSVSQANILFLVWYYFFSVEGKINRQIRWATKRGKN